MRFLNRTAILVCSHGGTARFTQPPVAPDFTLDGSPVATDRDLLAVGPFVGCSQVGTGVSPCVGVDSITAGRVAGVTAEPVGAVPLLETVVAITKASPPGLCRLQSLGTATTSTTLAPSPAADRTPKAARKPAKPRPKDVIFELVDEVTGQPLPGAVAEVRVAGETVRLTADRRGRVRIRNVPEGGATLVAVQDAGNWRAG